MKNRPTRLLIDDVRGETNVKCELDIIARNYWTGLECLKLRKWDILYLDHDLSSFETDHMGKMTNEKTGYDIICWLERNLDFLPERVYCVSTNPAGRKRIEQVLMKLYGKVWIDSTAFTYED